MASIAIMIIVVFLFMAMWATRYVKGSPNKVLIVSGRKIRLPDGTFRGYRIVKGGGTFVLPILEKVDVLSLDVMTLEFNRARMRNAKGVTLIVDGAGQFKINGDDLSIATAAEQLLGKSEDEIKTLVRLVLEKHFGAVAGSSGAEDLSRDLDGYANRIQTAAGADLGKMGISLVSLLIREIR